MNAAAHPLAHSSSLPSGERLLSFFLGISYPLLSWFSLSGISVPKILALLDQPFIFFVRSLYSQRYFLSAACLCFVAAITAGMPSPWPLSFSVAALSAPLSCLSCASKDTYRHSGGSPTCTVCVSSKMPLSLGHGALFCTADTHIHVWGHGLVSCWGRNTQSPDGGVSGVRLPFCGLWVGSPSRAIPWGTRRSCLSIPVGWSDSWEGFAGACVSSLVRGSVHSSTHALVLRKTPAQALLSTVPGVPRMTRAVLLRGGGTTTQFLRAGKGIWGSNRPRRRLAVNADLLQPPSQIL